MLNINKIHNCVRYYRENIKSNLLFMTLRIVKWLMLFAKGKNSNGKRVLVIDLSLIGDNVMVTLVIKNLLLNKSKVDAIDVLCFERGKDIFERCEGISNILTLKRRKRSYNKMINQLMRSFWKLSYYFYIIYFTYYYLLNKYSTVIVPKWNEDGEVSGELAYLTNAPNRIGFSEKVYEEKAIGNIGRDKYFSKTFLCKAECHESEKFLNLLEQAEYKIYERNILLPYNKIKSYKGFSLEQSYAVLALDTTALDKEWSIENFAVIARWLALNNVIPILLGTKIEYAEKFKALMMDLPYKSFVGETSISDTFDIIGNCSLYIGCDTGLSHIAGAVGAKGVVLFSVYKDTPPRCTPLACEHET